MLSARRAPLAGLLLPAALLLGVGCPADKLSKAPDRGAAARREPAPPDIPEAGPLAQKVYFEQGKSLLRAGRFARAEEMFRKAIAAHSKGELLPSCYLGLGSTLSEQKKGPESLKAYRAVVKLLPDDPDAHRALAMGLEEDGDLKGAAKALALAIDLAPDQLTTYLDLAAIYLRVKDLDSARKIYQSYEIQRTVLVRTLGLSKDRDQREAAALALGQARDEATAKALGLALTDSSVKVRLAVIQALGMQGLEAGAGPLKARLELTRNPVEKRQIQLSLERIAEAPQPEPGRPDPLKGLKKGEGGQPKASPAGKVPSSGVKATPSGGPTTPAGQEQNPRAP